MAVRGGKRAGRGAASLAESVQLAPGEARRVAEVLAALTADRWLERLWARDATLWTGGDEGQWLGWLDCVRDAQAVRGDYAQLAAEVRGERFTHAVLLGMGGSSLGPEVLRRSFGVHPGHPDLVVLDSTVPDQVRAVAEAVDLSRTLVLVASKSGTTLEPNLFLQWFYDRLRERVGETEAGRRCIAITDPGSKLEQVARELRFRHIVRGEPAIGGRFSVLSVFGLTLAAVIGIDVRRFLERAAAMVEASSPRVTPEGCPGVRLGAALGTLAKAGRDKVTIITSPAFAALGAWLEQLLAESTGKHGTGLVPVDQEPIGPPAVYGSDRTFVYVRDEAMPDAEQDRAVDALAAAGQPVIRIPLADAMDLGQEFFRWEVATAVAGSVLGIHPFDQPDVEAAKVATRNLVSEYEARGELPAETPLRIGKDLLAPLREHLGKLGPGDYFGVLAYLPMNPAHASELTAIRSAVRDAKRVATCGGFGPRYLHSTGQVYKGGPVKGVFLVLTGDPLLDQAVPGQRATFGVVAAAQARGDAAVMVERGQRVLRVHLGRDVGAELAALRRAVIAALK